MPRETRKPWGNITGLTFYKDHSGCWVKKTVENQGTGDQLERTAAVQVRSSDGLGQGASGEIRNVL